MPEHTPGPWERLVGITEEGHKLGAGKTVVRIVPKRKPDEVEFRRIALVDCEKPMANARLIAAAPDLYEALKEAKAIIGCTVPRDWKDMNLPVPDTKSWAAALAKAEGKDND